MFNVGDPGRYRLERAPLVQAIVQVRFPLIAHLQTTAGVAPLQDRLRNRYPYMTQRQELAVQLGAAPGSRDIAAGIAGAMSWELTDDDGRVLVINVGSVTLSVGNQYAGVEEFAGRFTEIATALAEVEAVRRCDRLGVRYLSVAETPPGDELAWQEWFRPELIGWVAGDVFAEGTTVVAALNQVQLSTPASGALAASAAEVQAAVRHGFVPTGTGLPGVPPLTTSVPSYILDLDMFVEAGQVFDAELLTDQFTLLHAQIDRFFRWTLTVHGEEHFGLEVLT
ncbi:MAG: TIGR04255 family protein [Chloroflexota bacterium]